MSEAQGPAAWYTAAVEAAMAEWTASNPSASFPLSDSDFASLTALINRRIDEAQAAQSL